MYNLKFSRIGKGFEAIRALQYLGAYRFRAVF
jgi:hypothetical protein